MSIYVVNLNEWYPAGDEMHETVCEILKLEVCETCGMKPNIAGAMAHHSLPWGHYNGVWCSEACYSHVNES